MKQTARDAVHQSSPARGLVKRLASRRQGRYLSIFCAVIGLLILLIVAHGFRFQPGGTLVRVWEFSPLASRGHSNLGWSTDPSFGGYLGVMTCAVGGETTAARFHHPDPGPVEIWVATRDRQATTFDLGIHLDGRAYTMRCDRSRHFLEKRADWLGFRCEQAVPAGDGMIVLTARPPAGQASAEAGDMYIVDGGEPIARVHPVLHQLLWRAGRSIGIALLVAAALSLGGLRRRPWVLAILAYAVGVFLEIYIPTARWGYSDDNWHMFPDQSPLLQGKFSALQIIHLGHVIPLYRVILELYYLAAGTDATLIRASNIIAMLATVWLLWRLMIRWTRSILAATGTAAAYLLNTRIWDEQLWQTSAHSATLCVLLVVFTLSAMDRYLRRGQIRWLIVSAVAAFAAPLFYAAGIIAFPLAALQWIFLYPRLLRDRRRLALGCVIFGVSLGLFFLVFNMGIVTTEADSNVPSIKTAGELRDAVFHAGRMTRKALLWALQSYDTGLDGTRLAVGGWVLAGMAPCALAPGAGSRLRRVFIAGLLMALSAYAVIFSVRTQESFGKSHYQVMAFVGLSFCFSAALAGLRRWRVGRMLFAIGGSIAMAFGAWQALGLCETRNLDWDYLFGRQDRLLKIMAAETAGIPRYSDAPFLSNYRIRHIAATTEVTISQLASVVDRTRFDELGANQLSAVDDLASPRVRELYKHLATEAPDELLPPLMPGVVLIASPQGTEPTRDLFRLTSPDAEAMAVLELPVESGALNPSRPALDRAIDGTWMASITDQTRLRVYVPSPCLMRLTVRFHGSGVTPVTLLQTEPASNVALIPGKNQSSSATLPLHAGVNSVRWTARLCETPPSPRKLVTLSGIDVKLIAIP